MQDFLHSPDAGATITTSIIFVCIAIVVLGSVIAVQWRKRRQVEIQADLTKGMVDAGMSAEEIVSVLRAATDADETVRLIQAMNEPIKTAGNPATDADETVRLIPAAKGKSPGNPSSQSPSKAMSDSKG